MHSTVISVSKSARSPAYTLSAGASFWLLASVTVSFLAGSSIPTPLYPLYQSLWGLTSMTITVVFGVYALGVLAALLFAGRLSDHLGRRPVLIAAAAGQVAVMIMFATADGAAGLIAARVLQGLTAGAALAAAGAAMIDLNKARGTTANAVAPPFGSALGGLLGGFFLQFLPAPTEFIYGVMAAVFAAQVVGLALMKEPIAPRPGAWQSLKPQLALPVAAREPLLLALPVLIALWALGGFYSSLAPMLVRGMLASHAPMLGGLAIFLLAATGGIAVLLLRSLEPRRMMVLGSLSLLVGIGIVMWAMSRNAPVVFFLGTAVAGLGFGPGFQGAVRSVVSVVAPHERAGTLSIVFIVSYISFGLPAMIAGAMVRHATLLPTAQVFSAVVMALAAAALIATTLRLTSSSRAPARAAARRY
jgi:predicted MFS family arabinose efflux permease